jgi:hypothetical protein
MPAALCYPLARREAPRPTLGPDPGPSLRRSSVVERAAVNRLVVGSSPTAGATFTLSRASCNPLVTIRIQRRVTLGVHSQPPWILEDLTASRCFLRLMCLLVVLRERG